MGCGAFSGSAELGSETEDLKLPLPEVSAPVAPSTEKPPLSSGTSTSGAVTDGAPTVLAATTSGALSKKEAEEEEYTNEFTNEVGDEEEHPGDEFFSDATAPVEPAPLNAQSSSSRRPAVAPVSALASSPMHKALRELMAQYPFLTAPEHPLHYWVRCCQQAVEAGEEDQAADYIGRIEQEVEAEERCLTAAFQRFNPSGSGSLSFQEVKFMFEYLGFPSGNKDVKKVIQALDKEHDGKMSLEEFQLYVGRMGGTEKLFEIRRKQHKAKAGEVDGAEDDAVDEEKGLDKEELKTALLDAGIERDAQACWSLVVPASELKAAGEMVDCQKRAIRHIRTLAKMSHEAALPTLQKRVKKLQFTDNDLWMTLAWIREMAPIIVHCNLDKIMQFFEEDTHYRNQFETNTSGGLLKPTVREKWERDLFGGCYEKIRGFDRPKYGVLNAMNDFRGVTKCKQYGDSYFILKDARLRCTLSPEDSANLKANRLAVLDFYAHVLAEYTDKELKETLLVANSGDAALLGDSDKVGNMKYKETQIHGEISWSRHVERLVANERHRKDADRLLAIVDKTGFKFSWMDEERQRMENENKEKIGGGAWKDRLKSLMTEGVPDAPDVPEGFCRTGCGRPVQAGLTAKGKAYKTCCRGCVLGFGHDMLCGNIDASLLGEGMCSRGCGRKVATGLHPSGRPFTTCCRGCAFGLEHDPGCNRESDEPIEPGFCNKGCGRKKAVGKDGRMFATCCRGCACGYGHSKTCCA